jgi:hypothetical protein
MSYFDLPPTQSIQKNPSMQSINTLKTLIGDEPSHPHTNRQIHHQMNSLLYDRNIPSALLQPYVNVRSVSTKYSLLPVVDPRKIYATEVPMVSLPNYNIERVMNPGNTKSPWSGYKVNDETILRNQIFANQKCDLATYVPSSHSDLYQSKERMGEGTGIPSMNSDLYSVDPFSSFDPNPQGVGRTLLFNTPTRTEMSEMADTPERIKDTQSRIALNKATTPYLGSSAGSMNVQRSGPITTTAKPYK